MIKAVRGTRDLLPPETALWNFVESSARAVFQLFNFQEIRTPIFEETQLFARSVGEETDIVSKEMYTFEDRGRAESVKRESLTLRPENTAGVVRAYIEHKLWERTGVQKLFYMGPQFRRERPQKGRYRQFYQIGAEMIGPPSAGSESPLRDAEVLEMLATLLDRTCLSVWTGSTRSDWLAITSSMSLYAPGISSSTPLSLRQMTPFVCRTRSSTLNCFCAALRLILRPAPCAQDWKLSAEPVPRTM